VAGARGEAVRAARLYGAAEALRGTLGAPLPPADLARHERHLAAARSGMDHGDGGGHLLRAGGREPCLIQAYQHRGRVSVAPSPAEPGTLAELALFRGVPVRELERLAPPGRPS
jgi:hypothetical protein